MTSESINMREKDERHHFDVVRKAIKTELDQLGGKVSMQYAEVMELKKYLQETKADMDHMEKASVRQTVDQMTRIGDHKRARQQRLSKLYQTPYFGRIDFRPRNANDSQAIYIGIHSFHDEAQGVHLVHDWRAPMASMFYDFELGDAYFDAPDGRFEGRLILKRQYRIEDGKLVFMLETSLNIHDELLQRELSRTSDDRMKNIVATIQRDQNAIIRNQHSHALIIQGAAGSGKTSIALHRIAFLLYKYKDTINSEDILIISPNKVFAHYISQVLPELGEQMIKETTMEVLGTYLLNYKVTFQTFFEQVSILLVSGNAKYADRISFKATAGFVVKLNEYATHVRNTNLWASHLDVNGCHIPTEWIDERFRQCGIMPYAQQIIRVTDAIVRRLQLEQGIELAGRDRARVRGRLKSMFKYTNMQAIYKAFYTWLGMPEMYKMGKGSVYEYADVFPLIYLTMLLEGVTPHDQVKHLVIDEMQDYTPVQYQVIAQLFRCKKTILGDHNQSVNPLSASPAETIRTILPRAECMTMNKSYRSTLQITALAQRIRYNQDLVPIERHGDEPDIIACADKEEEIRHIRQGVLAFLASDDRSLGIICKTQSQANDLHALLRDLSETIQLLNSQSTIVGGGVVVACAHLAKGLEFDRVIVPFCSATNYSHLIDRHMLYVACTRAMHKLSLTHTAKRSPFLNAAIA